MNLNILKIFSNNIYELICIERIIYYIKLQNYEYVHKYTPYLLDGMSERIALIFSEKSYFNNKSEIANEKVYNSIFVKLLEAQKEKNYVLLLDIYSHELLPFYQDLQEYILFWEEDLIEKTKVNYDFERLKEDNREIYEVLKESEQSKNDSFNQYIIEMASSGSKTIKIARNTEYLYLHSNIHPLKEAFYLANNWYKGNKMKYVLYGIGMGHHISMLLGLNNDVIIDIYESDLNMIKIAYLNDNYGVYSNINHIHIHYDPSLDKLQRHLENMSMDDTKFVVHYPTMYSIKDEMKREKLEEFIKNYGECC